MTTFAVVPAAGHSRRMGRPKLGLPLGDSTVIGCVVRALRQGGVAEVLVVTGPHVPEVAGLAEAAGATVLRLDAETPDMRTTIERGLDWLERCRQPTADDDWLLCPADHPTLRPEVVRAIIQARRDRPTNSVVIPTFEGRRGHPTSIAWEHVARIRRLPPDQGLNTYLRSQDSQTILLSLPSSGILTDLDTPGDYERLLREFDAQVQSR